MNSLSSFMPAGWPASLWFFILTAVVFLLQRFPLTGVFLMIVGAAFWSILLVNLGMLGIVVEALTGRSAIAWLLVPALYFGGYYLAYFHDQQMLAMASRQVAAENQGKALRFDPASQDLLLEDPKDGLGVQPAEFTQHYGLARTFNDRGDMFLIGTSEACKILRDNQVLATAGIQSYSIGRRVPGPKRRNATGYCTIIMPGTPDRPVVRITQRGSTRTQGWLPLVLRTLTASDDASGASASVITGSAGPLRRFPMPAIGCALNSGAPSWECFAGFMRGRVALVPGVAQYSNGLPVLAPMLGLIPVDNLAAHAIGPDRFKPMADRADAELAATEVAMLEAILTDPLAPTPNTWFRHLPNRPDLVAPFAGRIFAALGQLQGADRRGGSNGHALWRLVAILPDPALAPHRSRMIEWMKPGAIREWTSETWQLFTRLDVTDPVERELVLARLERPGELSTQLFDGFCRMGVAAPPDAKQRLLAIWTNRGAAADASKSDRGRDEVKLYLALARMGLKQQAGQVEQRYMGTAFAGIWNQITPETGDDVCGLSDNDLWNRLRKR